ncbi:hypothetical protein B296_00004446 [Ensete ventricosum]|uniref:Uncharacterized protein n=1 Tax=Ensete ventricosum TaxID=4639 RepID=A0A427ANW0_ENSVE|nr:hypothetical protein B296_00004446 [Ensete ventricosum]
MQRWLALQGRQATTWPPVRGWPVVAKAPCKGVAGCGQGQPARGGARPLLDRRDSRSRVVGCSSTPARGSNRPQEGSLRAEALLAWAVARRSDRQQGQHLWRCRLREQRRPRGRRPLGRVAAGWQGSYSLCRDDNDTVRIRMEKMKKVKRPPL